MKFDCGPDENEEREARLKKRQEDRKARGTWHRFFAIWPRQVASHDCRWLEWIERKDANIYEQFGYYNSYSYSDSTRWIYRAID